MEVIDLIVLHLLNRHLLTTYMYMHRHAIPSLATSLALFPSTLARSNAPSTIGIALFDNEVFEEGGSWLSFDEGDVIEVSICT